MAFQEKLILDVKEPQHREVIFRPQHLVMRAEVNIRNLKKSANDRLFMVGGVIPGDRFTVDFKTMKWSLVDKLTLKENKELATKVKDLMAADPINPQKVSFHDEKTGEIADDPDTIATWLWHIWSGVKEGLLTVVEGKIPSENEIRRIGRVQTSSPGEQIPEKLAERACFLPKVEDKQLVGAK